MAQQTFSGVPGTFSAGEILTASDQEKLRDFILYLIKDGDEGDTGETSPLILDLGSDIVDIVGTIKQDTVVGRVTPSGSIVGFGGSSAPAGWILCDGAAVSRTTYADLFSAISTAYGVGDGSSTFNVPNLKGKVPVGLDAAVASFDALAETGGASTVTLATSDVPAHQHAIYGATGGGATAYRRVTTSLGDNYAGSLLTILHDWMQSSGGGGSHNNLQPYVVINYIIAI